FHRRGRGGRRPVGPVSIEAGNNRRRSVSLDCEPLISTHEEPDTMSTRVPKNAPRGARPVRPTLRAAAVLGAVAAAAVVVTAQADAATLPTTARSSHDGAHVPRPKLRHGTLIV